MGIEMTLAELSTLAYMANAVRISTLNSDAKFDGENFTAEIWNRAGGEPGSLLTMIKITTKESKEG